MQRLRPGLSIRERAPLACAELLRVFLGRLHEPPATLLIGAGRATHLSLLAFKRATGAPVVVLMRPSLPYGCFDLCLVPEHDRPAPKGNVILTRGALNRMRPGDKTPGEGLILLGGPSKHFRWDDDRILTQLRRLIAQDPRRWTLTTSRRTPASLLPALAQLPGIELVPAGQTGPDWLPARLASAELCWVSADSVSMLFEALSAGCAVGLLELDAEPGSRVGAGVRQAIEQGLATPMSHWQGEALVAPAQRFNEAERCARLIEERLHL
ncbi:mitochondrial fission ELM1 family protein [Marinobacterium aestuariivivens]|uniref:Mitochondrial fission ELM1 family protein n=1 Tax=Marinobacterium aestuariivivens TaxID=1698799 RepID=A0ABW1ZYV1_9GAMM